MIPGLSQLQDRVIIEMLLTIENDCNIVRIPSEHLWLSESERGRHHGFRFENLADNDRAVFEKYIARLKKHYISPRC